MFSLCNNLKKVFLLYMLLACTGLAAEDLMVAMLEPSGPKGAKPYFGVIRNAFMEKVVNTIGFQLMDRMRTDKILEEHRFQRSGLMASNEARELGKFLGVDIIIDTEVTLHGDQETDVEVSCQALDIVTGRILGSKSELINDATTQKLLFQCREMMVTMLNGVNKNLAGGIDKAREGSGGKPELRGLDKELRTMLTNFKGIAKWNNSKASYSLDIDLSDLSFIENRQYGYTTYRVRGNIAITLMDAESGNNSAASFVVEEFPGVSSDQIKNKIKSQAQSQIADIVRDLLAGLD